MKICPECQTPQQNDTPFCENCGFRLRSQETALEGLPAISPEMLKASELRRPERVATAEDFALPPSAKSRAPRQTEEEPAVPAPLIAPNLDATRAPKATPSADLLSPDTSALTRMEGLPAVSRKPPVASEDGKNSAISPLKSDKSTEGSSLLLTMPGAPSKRPSPWITLAVGATLGVAIGAAVGWSSGGRTQQHTVTAEARAQSRASIPAGSFSKGLDETTRSVLLQACYKVADDPDEECDQDKLLDGEFPAETGQTGAYEIDANEVTGAEYDACVSAGRCQRIDYKKCLVYTNQGLQISLRVPKALQQLDKPLVCVTHSEAAAYCEYVGGSLPTHDQWEKAARGGEDNRLFPWGDTWDPAWANWGEFDVIKTSILGKVDGFEWTSSPGVFSQGDSPYGVRDMAGNVSEWVAETTERDGVARGGSWTSDPFGLRVTSRAELPVDKRRSDVGFRCAY